jgi:hypothetical protein
MRGTGPVPGVVSDPVLHPLPTEPGLLAQNLLRSGGIAVQMPFVFHFGALGNGIPVEETTHRSEVPSPRYREGI